jgi:hypothetical protein
MALFSQGSDADAIRINAWMPIGGIVAVAWCTWIVIQMVRKHDPIYDQIAGTAVIKN